MIEVIIHIFILVPLFTHLKQMTGALQSQKAAYAFGLLAMVASFQVWAFLSQGKTSFQSYRVERKENYYDLMGVKPRSFTQSELKNSYR